MPNGCCAIYFAKEASNAQRAFFVSSHFCPFYLCYTALVWFTLSPRNFLCEIDEQIHEKLLPNRKFFLILTREFFLEMQR